MERIDAAGVEIQVIRIWARRIVVGILRRLDPQPARHVQEIGNANLGARIARTLPLRNRRRLPYVVDAPLDQDAQECGRQALAHRPALERRVHRDAFPVPLADEAPSPRHHEGGRHACGRLEGRVHCSFHFGRVEFRGQRVARQHITHGPQLC